LRRTPGPRSALRAALIAAVAAAALPSFADEILLTNGNKLEGKARRENGKVVIDTGTGEVTLPAEDVRQITAGPTRLDLYRERIAKLDAKDAAAHIAVADWCREKKLPDLEKQHLRAVLSIDADHEAARTRLGFIRYDGKWLTETEYRLARGFVKVGDEWLTPDEIEARKSAAAAAKAQKEHVKVISGALAKLSSPLRDTRKQGRIALLTYAEKISDTRLAEFTLQVASYYNEAWRAVKAEYALAKTDVRATVSTLKRPIPTLTTSLGANSTPVTVQLPELSIMSIRTTALVPMKIELDEE
jgi:hypothetical protein